MKCRYLFGIIFQVVYADNFIKSWKVKWEQSSLPSSVPPFVYNYKVTLNFAVPYSSKIVNIMYTI